MTRKRISNVGHWAAQRERGNLSLMRLTVWLTGRLGRRLMTPIITAVVVYFYLFGPKARRHISRYQQLLKVHHGNQGLVPSTAPVYKQFLAFAQACLDKIDVWQDRITLNQLDIEDPDHLHDQMGQGRGQILLGAHLGNIEICRALAHKHQKLVLNVLIHSKHAQSFNQLLAESGAENVRLIQVSELDAPTMMNLHQRVQNGEWLALTGDRVPLTGSRVLSLDFLGAKASFPQGPWLLAGLLHCPVNLLICTRESSRFRLRMQRLSDSVTLDRKHREASLQPHAQRYADRLAEACASAPLQWFNFFDFWGDDA